MNLRFRSLALLIFMPACMAFIPPTTTITPAPTFASSSTSLPALLGAPFLRPVGLNQFAAVGHLSAFSSLDRVKIRMEGFGTYAVVAALMLNASLRIFTGTSTTNKLNEEGRISTPTPAVIFLASTALTFLQALHATVTFTLIPIYAKTALGLGLDGKFSEFLASTSIHRKIGFDTFFGSIVTLLFSVCSSFWLRMIHCPLYRTSTHEELRGESAERKTPLLILVPNVMNNNSFANRFARRRSAWFEDEQNCLRICRRAVCHERVDGVFMVGYNFQGQRDFCIKEGKPVHTSITTDTPPDVNVVTVPPQ